MTGTVSGGANAADRTIDTVDYPLVVDMDNPRMKSVGDALGACEIG
jgi:hypothetical protein